ncbi:MAG: phage holin family protein [Dermatophilaceae bacterium]
MGFLVRTVAVAVALAVAAWIVPGIELVRGGGTQQLLTLIGVALIIGLVNAFVRPIVSLLTGCLVLLSFGLFLLVVNAWMLQLTSWIAGQLGLGFRVDGFGPALLGSIIVSLVSWAVSGLLTPTSMRRR